MRAPGRADCKPTNAMSYRGLVTTGILIFVGICIAGGRADAQGRGRGRGQANKEAAEAAPRADVDINIDVDAHRRVVREYYTANSLPPGLAKRQSLPPGLQKQLVERGTLPPGLQKRLVPVSPVLVARMP